MVFPVKNNSNNFNNDKIYNRPVTHHAKERLTERTSLSLKNFKKQSTFIYKHGYKIRCFTGELYSYLVSKQLDGGEYVVRVWEEYVFIYNSRLKRLLTVYPIPECYLPISQYLLDGSNSEPAIIWIKMPDGSSQYVSEHDSLTDDIGAALEFGTKQKATNFVKNNRVLSVLEKQGAKVIVL